LTKQLVLRASWEGIESVGQSKRWPGGVTAVNEEEVVTELRAQVYREVLELFEGDTVAADQWLSSPISGLKITPRYR